MYGIGIIVEWFSTHTWITTYPLIVHILSTPPLTIPSSHNEHPVPPGNYARNIFELLPRDPLTEVKQEGVCMRVDERGDFFVGLVPGKPYEVGAALAILLLFNLNRYLPTYHSIS